MVHRFHKTPLEQEDFQDELNKIKNLAETNGYDGTLITDYYIKTETYDKKKAENNIHKKGKTFTTFNYFNNHINNSFCRFFYNEQ